MIEYFVVKNVANMMTKADPDSALDSQAIAGTIVTIEKEESNYCHVKTPDLYHGWIAQQRLIEAWDRSHYQTICISSIFAPVYTRTSEKSPLITKLVIGTHIPITQNIDEFDNEFVEILLPDKQIGYIDKHCFELWNKSPANEMIFEEKWRSSNTEMRNKIIAELGKNIVETAKRFMGTPYLWGGTTPFGMDCSGLTQLVYKLNGVQLLRDSYMQYADKRFNKIEEGKALGKASLQAGDLLFFDIKRRGKIDHVGIACGDATFIQSRGEMLDGGTVINKCSDNYYNEVYFGAMRLSAAAEINISSAV